jgi:hypothetical protein
MTDAESKTYYKCREGYVCDFGTTPDADVRAPFSQFKALCPAGYSCGEGTGVGQARRNLCREDYFCPTGTVNEIIGYMAKDSITRNLTVEEADPFYNEINLKYLGNDDIRALSDHDMKCFGGIDQDLYSRFQTVWEPVNDFNQPPSQYPFADTYRNFSSKNPTVKYLNRPRPGFLPFQDEYSVTGYECNEDGVLPYNEENVMAHLLPFGWNSTDIPAGKDWTWLMTEVEFNDRCYYRPSIRQGSLEADSKCGRDHYWRLVDQAINRRECDCVSQVVVVMAVYRFWRCTSSRMKFGCNWRLKTCPDDVYFDSGIDDDWSVEESALTNFGIGSTYPFGTETQPIETVTHYGGRDYWFPRKHLSKKVNGSDVGTERDYTCKLKAAPVIDGNELFNISHGELDSMHPFVITAASVSLTPKVTNKAQTRDMTGGLTLQWGWKTCDGTDDELGEDCVGDKLPRTRTYMSYRELKAHIEVEFEKQLDELTESISNGDTNRLGMDPFTYDLMHAIRLIEEYGEDTPYFINMFGIRCMIR